MKENLGGIRAKTVSASSGILGELLASAARVRLVTFALLRQNRVLVGLLLLWPCVLSGVLVAVDHGRPATEDVAAILQQELFYGLVLVGLGASVGLGTEMRARRVQQVLGRAVGRTEYLLALGTAAFLPFAGYVLVWLLTASAFAGLLHLHAPMLAAAVLAEAASGVLLCAAGLLFSVLLPQTLAAVATGGALTGLLTAARFGWGGVAQLFNAAIGGLSAVGALWGGVGEALIAAAVLTAFAAVVFAHKDLKPV